MIVIEDAVLCPQLALCTWLMAAWSKGFRFALQTKSGRAPPRSRQLFLELLRAVAATAALRVKDDVWSAEGTVGLVALEGKGKEKENKGGGGGSGGGDGVAGAGIGGSGGGSGQRSGTKTQPLHAVRLQVRRAPGAPSSAEATKMPHRGIPVDEKAWRLALSSTSSMNTLLHCLRLRARFGGMAGDMQMLSLAARAWFARSRGFLPFAYLEDLTKGSGASSTPTSAAGAGAGGSASGQDSRACFAMLQRISKQPSEVPPTWLEPLRPADIPLAAIDFHCSAVARAVPSSLQYQRRERLEEVAREGGYFNLEAALKAAIWDCSSCLNARRVAEQPRPGCAASSTNGARVSGRDAQVCKVWSETKQSVVAFQRRERGRWF